MNPSEISQKFRLFRVLLASDNGPTIQATDPDRDSQESADLTTFTPPTEQVKKVKQQQKVMKRTKFTRFEKLQFYDALEQQRGKQPKDFEAIASLIKTKSAAECSQFCENQIKKIGKRTGTKAKIRTELLK